MTEQHKGIILRAPSVYKYTVTLFDDRLGKIEGICSRRQQLSHGYLISYSLEKRGARYFLREIQLLEMPFLWARDNFLFFHHVLELCDYFVPWHAHCEELFRLVYFLYKKPEAVQTASAQKAFLCSFFTRVGVHPEPGEHTIEQWLKACMEEHPQVMNLRTAGFLKTLEGYEELA